MKTSKKISRTGNPVELGLSLTAGFGLLVMMVGLGLGVVGGANADSDAIGFLFIVGVVIFLLGSVGWFAVAQPHKHFDDINIPADEGHHHEEHHSSALAVHESAEVTQSEHH